jgi:hypothetical protein
LVKPTITGLGFTVMDMVCTFVQPFGAVAVLVIVPEILALVVFVVVKLGKLPVPLAPIPIAVLLFAHAKVVPAVVLVKAAGVCRSPGQATISGKSFKEGFGLMVMVKNCGVPTQPFKVGVTPKFATKSVKPLLSGAV